MEQAVTDHNYGVVILNRVNGSDRHTIGSQLTPPKSPVKLFFVIKAVGNIASTTTIIFFAIVLLLI